MDETAYVGPTPEALLYVAGIATSAACLRAPKAREFVATVETALPLEHAWLGYAAMGRHDPRWVFARYAPLDAGGGSPGGVATPTATVDVEDVSGCYSSHVFRHTAVLLGVVGGRLC